jgi:hypothetical protein
MPGFWDSKGGTLRRDSRVVGDSSLYGVTLSTSAIVGVVFVVVLRGQGQQQPWQVMATIDQADIRGSEPHNHGPSGAASDYARESG